MRNSIHYARAILLLAIAMLATSLAHAQYGPPNSITFENRSGEPALVKVVGPTPGVVSVPNQSQAGVQVSSGEYYILVRYGAKGHYTYSRGHQFSVEQVGNSYSEITITLHRVANGNYDSRPIPPGEFDRR